MIKDRLHFHLFPFLILLPLASCSLISESGPVKGKIQETAQPYVLVEVKSRGDIPSRSRQYGLAQLPQPIKGQGYSDKVRTRDSIQFVITDLSPQSPFFTQGGAYRFGPLEVPEDGRVSVPYVGEIEVLDLSLSEISTKLADKIKPVSKTAEVTVFRNGRIPRTANVIGEVKNPGPVPLERNGITSLDLLAASGGPSRAEHLFKYTLRRAGSDYNFDYQGFRRHAFPVEEGDLLTVTTDFSNRFHVMGAINRPTTVPFPTPAPTLADALGAAAGLDERRSDPSGVFVFRKGHQDEVFTFNLKEPSVVPLVQRFPIQGEDIVYITEAPLARWNRLITLIFPNMVFQAATAASRYAP